MSLPTDPPRARRRARPRRGTSAPRHTVGIGWTVGLLVGGVLVGVAALAGLHYRRQAFLRNADEFRRRYDQPDSLQDSEVAIES